MNNNGMIEYKENFISKIRKKLKKIFGKQEQIVNNVQEETKDLKIKEINDKKTDFINGIKFDEENFDNVIEMKEFLEKIDGNEEALNMLSIDRLEKLEKYYNTIIEQNNNKIKKLKSEV